MTKLFIVNRILTLLLLVTAFIVHQVWQVELLLSPLFYYGCLFFLLRIFHVVKSMLRKKYG